MSRKTPVNLSTPSALKMEDHVHCVSCINLRCTVKPQPGISCDLTSCPLLCGAGFHSCKSEEHQLLCPMMRVPCLNSGYGCPATLIRNQMSAHLDVCPAGVVCCTMEWNRCPVSCLDYTSYESLSRVVEEVEQLDMALALQDQRTLLKSLEVFAMMAPSAQEEPLVPLSQENNEKHSALHPSDSEASTSFGTQPSQPNSRDLAKEKILRGINCLNEEHFSKLYEATVETARSLAAALDFVSSAGCGARSYECLDSRDALLKQSSSSDEGICNGLEGTTPEGDESLHQRDIKELNACSSCLNENGAAGANLTIKNTPNGPMSAATETFLETACRPEGQENNMDVSEESSTPQMLSPVYASPGVAQMASHIMLEDGELVPSEGRFNTDQLVSDQEYSLSNGEIIPHKSLGVKMEDKAVDTSDLEQGDDPMGLGGIDLITAALLFCLASRECRRISDTVHGDGYRVDFGTQTFTFPAAILVTNTRVGDMASASACDHAAPQLAYPSPFRTLLLNLVPEALKVEAAPYIPFNPSYQHTFPFICSQPFRRDQFSSHFRNVHGDIHAGLNGWMEHRCPLAYYGCTFSQRRFYPTTRGAKVVHDRHLKSFGVQPCPKLGFSSESQSDQLSGLPIEILWHIGGFLDSFSLCQLSLVSRRMREVCASLLQTRGIVELQWELRRCPRGPGTVSWQIKNKVWRFSTAFSPVTSWGFTDIPSMSVHLKKCHFNVAEHRTVPVPLPAMCTGRDRLYLRRVLRHVYT